MCSKLVYLVSFVLVLALVSNASAGLVSQYKLDNDETDEEGTNHGSTFVAGGSGTGGFKSDFLSPAPSGTTHSIETGMTAGQGFQRINIPNLTGMSVSAGSVALWARHATSTSELDTRYMFGGGADGDRLQIFMDNSDRQLDLGFGDQHYRAANIATFTDEVWYHVALTWDAGTYEVYVSTEGLVAGNIAYVTGSYTGFNTFGGNAHISNNGDEPGSHSQCFAGRVDEVRLYSHAISEGEVEGLIPEPATIALLGLGGLALLRRKR